MKENSEKSNKEKGYVYSVTSEGGDAENHVHKPRLPPKAAQLLKRKHNTN